MERSDVDAIFSELTSGLIVPEDISSEFKRKHPTTFEPLDHIKDRLVKTVDELIVIIRDPKEEIDDMEQFIDQLTDILQHNFEHIDGLSSGDAVMTSGDSVIMLMQGDRGSFGLAGISNEQQVRGTFEFVVITQVPTEEAIPLMQIFDNDIDDEADITMTKNPGVALLVTDAIIVEEDGSTKQAGDNGVVLIPLNYPDLRLSKLV